jgi:dTMP kinase
VVSGRVYPGYLIAFEGPDGAGRREALSHARWALQARGKEVVVTRPIGSTLGAEIYRNAAPLNELSPRTLLLVAASDLAERLEWEILPALRAGKVVLADRYLYRVVQGAARDLDPDWLEVLCMFAPEPSLIFHYVADPAELSRKLDISTLDLYEAGMDLGLTRDVPFSYELYQDRLLLAYEQWAADHGTELVRPISPDDLVARLERLLRLESGVTNARHQAVMELMHDSYHDPPHAMHVALLARQLFDQLQAVHQLGPEMAELFEYGVLLHNVGENGRDVRDAHVRTAAVVRESALKGFTEDELNVIGVLAATHTVHHQRELDAWLETVPTPYRDVVRRLAPIARLADGMDVSHVQTVRWVEAIVQEEGKLLVRMQSRTKARPEVKATRERAHLMQRVYGLEVEVMAERQGPPPASADLGPSIGSLLSKSDL